MTHRARIEAICEARGIEIYRTERGTLRLYGPGVDIVTMDLAFVNVGELAPIAPSLRFLTLGQRETDVAHQAARAASLLPEHSKDARNNRPTRNSRNVTHSDAASRSTIPRHHYPKGEQ